MAEAGEEKPKRCHCGFWGSPQTKDMCSKCYKEHLQQGKAAKVDAAGGGGTPSSSTQKTALLEQLGLVASAMNGTSTTSPNNAGPSEGHSSEEKTDSQAEGEKKEEREAGDGADPFLPTERPPQKNKKKCWICKSKLELAQRELGTCKCGYVFCFLHRLPEQHDCIYDHKEGGRQQAMKEMTPVGKKKIGRSFHRMDSRPE